MSRVDRRFNPIGRLANAAAGVVDVDRVLADVDVESIVERLDIDAIVDRIDVNALLDRVDPDRLLDRLDPNALLDRVDPDRLLDRVDPDALLDRVDPNALLDRVDPNALLDRVDPNALLDRVDPNALLDRVDPNRLLERVDTDALIARTDLNAAVRSIDIDSTLDAVDIKGVVERAGIPEIVSASTGHMAVSMLDVARRQLASVDQIIMRASYRAIGGDPGERPTAPPALAPSAVVDQSGRGVITGHYAGPLSRLGAFAADAALFVSTSTLLSAGVVWMLGGPALQLEPPPLVTGGLAVLGFLAWILVYAVVPTAVTGRTVGKGVVGLRVVSRSGEPVRIGQALGHVAFLPVDFLLFGLGFVGLFVGGERRGLHDVMAGTVVVYDWGDRAADLPAPLTRWLSRRHGDDLVNPAG